MMSFQHLPLTHFFSPSVVLGQQGCHLAGNAEDDGNSLGLSLGEHHLLFPPPYPTPEMHMGYLITFFLSPLLGFRTELLTHLCLTTPMKEVTHYYSHCADEETEAKRG